MHNDALSAGKKTCKTAPSRRNFVTLPVEDQATAIGNMHRKIGKVHVCFWRYPGGQTNRQDMLIALLRHCSHGLSKKNSVSEVVKLEPYNIVYFWATICKMVRPVLSDRCPVCLSVCPVCDIGVLWPNGWMDHAETWHGGRPRPRPYCVRWGPSSPHGKVHSIPHFRNLWAQALPASA